MCKAYGSFVMNNGYIFRTGAYLQWGKSDQIIGSCVLCNPGKSMLKNITLTQKNQLAMGETAEGEIEIDPTMGQIKRIIEGVNRGKTINGCVRIYNIFTVRNTKMDKISDIVNSPDIDKSILYKNFEDFSQSFKTTPWVLIGWGCEKSELVTLKKQQWLDFIKKEKIKYLGIPGKKAPHYLHPLPPNFYKMQEYTEAIIEQLA